MNTLPLRDQIQKGLHVITSEKDSGYSIWFGGMEHNTGYVVGYGKRGLNLHKRHAGSDAFVAHLCGMAMQLLQEGSEGVGMWVDGDTLYFDPIIWVADKTEAVMLALVYGELAIYDLGNSQTIYMEDYVRENV